MERKSAWSLPMSEQEIVNEYKNAKTPQKQIAILADQNACDKKTIVNILEAAGCELPGNFKKKKKALLEEDPEDPYKPPFVIKEAPEEAPDFSKVQPLNEEHGDNYKENRSPLSHEMLQAAAIIKAMAYDAIVDQLPAPWEDSKAGEFIATVSGIRALVKKLIKEA